MVDIKKLILVIALLSVPAWANRYCWSTDDQHPMEYIHQITCPPPENDDSLHSEYLVYELMMDGWDMQDIEIDPVHKTIRPLQPGMVLGGGLYLGPGWSASNISIDGDAKTITGICPEPTWSFPVVPPTPTPLPQQDDPYLKCFGNYCFKMKPL